METKTRQVPAPVLLEQYRVLLQDPAIESLPLVITGNSMTPFLVHGRDTVWLSRLQGPARRGDMVLYQRDNGDYILHRVLRTEGKTLTMLGDAQTVPEPGIRPEQIFAVVTAVERKGKRTAPGSFWWWFFRGPWLRMIPLRRPLMELWAALKKR